MTQLHSALQVHTAPHKAVVRKQNLDPPPVSKVTKHHGVLPGAPIAAESNSTCADQTGWD